MHAIRNADNDDREQHELTVAPGSSGDDSDLSVLGLSVARDKRSKRFRRVPRCHIADPGSFHQATAKIRSATTKNEMGITKK